MNVAGVIALGKAAITAQNKVNCDSRSQASKDRQFQAAQYFTNKMGNRLLNLASQLSQAPAYLDQHGYNVPVVSSGILNDELTSFTIQFPGDGSDVRNNLALFGLTADSSALRCPMTLCVLSWPDGRHATVSTFTQSIG
jgi:hypothetical protein